MAENLDTLNTAVSLLIRATLLAARFSGRVRQRYLKRLASRDIDAQTKEILFLKDRVYQLEMQVAILQKHLGKKSKRLRYTVHERLLILWHIETFQIPRRKVSRYFGIARSTLYRWLHEIEDQKSSGSPVNKTPAETAALVWEITKANVSWGRIRIANQLKLLNVFLSASTVRNILQQPEPRTTPASSAPAEKPHVPVKRRSDRSGVAKSGLQTPSGEGRCGTGVQGDMGSGRLCQAARRESALCIRDIGRLSAWRERESRVAETTQRP